MTFLFSAHYARKETVQGYLRPDTGLIKSYANRTGTIRQIFVKIGDFVEKGTPLVSIVIRQSMASGEEFSEKLIKEITGQLELLDDEAIQYQRLEVQELANINQRIKVMNSSQQIIFNQKILLQEKLQLLKQQQIQQQQQQAKECIQSKINVFYFIHSLTHSLTHYLLDHPQILFKRNLRWWLPSLE